jgi:hypothetical protein
VTRKVSVRRTALFSAGLARAIIASEVDDGERPASSEQA